VTVVVRGEEDGPDAAAIVEAAMMETGRAVLFVPADVTAEPIKGIAVAWNGSREAARAMALAMPVLEEAGDVVLLAGLSSSLAREDIDACATALGWHGVKARSVTFDGSDGNVAGRLQAEAREAGCQLLVLGAYSHSRLREFIFGGVTDDILAAVRMPVLLAH
jgi:nucleotide-binding universal stress UspA family protein